MTDRVWIYAPDRKTVISSCSKRMTKVGAALLARDPVSLETVNGVQAWVKALACESSPKTQRSFVMAICGHGRRSGPLF
jgi:hypothetical protein